MSIFVAALSGPFVKDVRKLFVLFDPLRLVHKSTPSPSMRTSFMNGPISNSLFHSQTEELLEPGAVVDHAGGAREGDDELLGEPVQPRREPLDPVARLRLRAGVEAELAHQRRQAARQVRHELVAPRQAAQVTLRPDDN